MDQDTMQRMSNINKDISNNVKCNDSKNTKMLL